jgi:hypothetical protein
MSKALLRNSDGNPFVYLETDIGSTAIGTDASGANYIVKIVTGLTQNISPVSAAGEIAIATTTPGNIEFRPKGTGQSTFVNGDVAITGTGGTPGNLLMNDTAAAGLSGVIEFGGNRFVHNFGSQNTFLGDSAGTFSLTVPNAVNNVAVGFQSMQSLTDGASNVGVGVNSGRLITTGTNNTLVGSTSGSAITIGIRNTLIGAGAAGSMTEGDNNIAIGFQPMGSLLTGDSNIAIGTTAGSAYTGSESSNIIINNTGTIADNNTIRIGTQGAGAGQQNQCFIAGINGTSVTAAGTVVIDASGQLGTSANLPIAVPVTVPNGGTGRTSLTDHGVLVGAGAAAITQLSVGTNGQVLLGSTGADPVFATLTSTGGTITFTPGAGTLNLEGAPAFTWSVITGDQTAVVNNGYICNKGSALLLALPATSAVGAVIEVTGINTALGWKVTQAAGQQIFFGTASTTSGATGFLQSTAIRDSIKMVCVVANLTWNVVSSVGNITVS